MLRAQYDRRGPVPQDVIAAVEFEAPRLEGGQVLVEVVAAPINPADVLRRRRCRMTQIRSNCR